MKQKPTKGECKKCVDEFMERKHIPLKAIKKVQNTLKEISIPRVVAPLYRVPKLKVAPAKEITRLMGGKPVTLKEPYTPAQAKKFRNKK